MIRRIRHRVPVLCALGLLAGTGTVLATVPVTQSQMESFVYRTMAGVISTALLVGAGVIAWLLARDRDINGKRFDDLSAEVRGALAALIGHNTDPLAHVAASEHNHGPMNDQSDRIEAKVDKIGSDLHDLKRDHDRIQSEEGTICEALAELRRRNPADSPNPKRVTDSGTDYTPLRGKQ